jgi:hypothetical protein
VTFLSLWVYRPILSLGRLHETFRFISVTRSRTVGTPWTGDQFISRPLLTAPGDCDDDDVEVGGINGFGRGNQRTRRKPAPTPLCPGANPARRGGMPAANRFSYGAARVCDVTCATVTVILRV